jgi:hypothetical protein
MIKKKICLVGAFAVGKTSLVRRYVHSIFSEKYLTTVGVKIDKKPVRVDDREIDLILWDLHGEDDFQSVRMSYLRGAAGCFFVADGTRIETLETAMTLQKRVRDAIGPVPSILAINKRDLSAQWEANLPEMDRIAASGIPIFETSAKTGQSVEDAFQALAAMTLEATV